MKSVKDVEIRHIVARFSSSGLLVKKEALDLLVLRSQRHQNLDELIDLIAEKVHNEGLRFVEARHISEVISERYGEVDKSQPVMEPTGFPYVPKAKGIDEDVKVLFGNAEGFEPRDDLEGYTEHFRDRYVLISKILKKRLDMSGVMGLKQAYSMEEGQKTKIIVLISEKRNSTLYVEDMTVQGQVYLKRDADEPLKRKFSSLMPDAVVGLWVVKFRKVLICEDIAYPDVPDSKPRVSKQEVAAVLTSDLHIGSKFFMKKEFRAFLRWLRGEDGDARSLDSASKVKYVLIAGDLIDGIGVYPNQDKELEVKSSYNQYEKAAELLAEIPDYIRVIVIPGNHDFTRKALPQPPISGDESKPLLDLRNVTLLPNPTLLSLHGVIFQLFHGQSLEDLASLVTEASHEKPDVSMEYLIKARHLAPFYGGKTEIQASGPDRLIIAEKPDVFHAGHVHIFGARLYRGVSVVNSGTWQSETPYQQMMGVKPTPGIFALYHLDTAELNRVRLGDIA